jgi:hypothetical protein
MNVFKVWAFFCVLVSSPEAQFHWCSVTTGTVPLMFSYNKHSFADVQLQQAQLHRCSVTTGTAPQMFSYKMHSSTDVQLQQAQFHWSSVTIDTAPQMFSYNRHSSTEVQLQWAQLHRCTRLIAAQVHVNGSLFNHPSDLYLLMLHTFPVYSILKQDLFLAEGTLFKWKVHDTGSHCRHSTWHKLNLHSYWSTKRSRVFPS